MQITAQGTEENPFVSDDLTAGIQEKINTLRERGGKLSLPCGRYDIGKTIQVILDEIVDGCHNGRHVVL